MKVKLTRSDGLVAEVEGTPEEVAAFLAAFAPLAPTLRLDLQPAQVPSPLQPNPWVPRIYPDPFQFPGTAPCPVWVWSGTLMPPASVTITPPLNDGGARPPLHPPVGVGG